MKGVSHGVGSAQKLRKRTLPFFGLMIYGLFVGGVPYRGISAFPVGVAAAQTQPPIRVQVDLQPVEVQVQDSKGNNISGLTERDFSVFENGKRQEIAFFYPGIGPVSLVVLVDSSSTVNSSGRLGSAQVIAAEFMRTARPEDDIFAMDFTGRMGPFQQLTREQILNPSPAALTPAGGTGSALYDAIATTLCHLRASKNLRQAIVVVTDGVDEYSRVSLEQLIGLVRSSHAQVFMIGLQSKSEFHFRDAAADPRLMLITGRDIDNPVVVFDRLMNESGTEAFIPESQHDLEDALKAVSNMLQSEYTVAYYPQKSPGKLRKIEVKVNLRGAHVLTRHFVYSQQDAPQFVGFDEATCTVSPRLQPYPYESKLSRGPSGTIYRDDFADSHSGWPIHENSRYVSGGYELSNLAVKVGNADDSLRVATMGGSGMPSLVSVATETMAVRENVVAAYGPWWANFRASLGVKMTPAQELLNTKSPFPYAAHPAAGLLFRMNPKGYYALLLGNPAKKNEASVKLVRRDFRSNPYGDYTETEIVPWTAIENTPSIATELSVEAAGNQISIFVGGQEIKTARDETYSQGWVGMLVSGPGHATFSNLVVEQR